MGLWDDFIGGFSNAPAPLKAQPPPRAVFNDIRSGTGVAPPPPPQNNDLSDTPGVRSLEPGAGGSPNPVAASNPNSPPAKAAGSWTDDDYAANEKAKAYAKMLVDNGRDPEEARRFAGVRTEPSDLAPATDARKGATFYDPATQGPQMSRSVMVDPGGRRTASWHVQQGIDAPDEAKDAARTADERARVAAGLDFQAGQKQAEFERGYLDRFEQAHASHAEEEKARAQRMSQEYDKSLGRLNALRAQVQKGQVNPFEGESGFGLVLQRLAIGLGAFGSAVNGGPNAALERMKADFQERIQKQQTDLEKSHNAIGAEQNFLGTLRQTFGDKKEADNAAWVAYLEKSKVELGKILGSPDIADPALMAKYERMGAALDNELALRLKGWHEAASDKVVRADVNAPPRYSGGSAKPGKPDELFVPTGPNGQGFQARTEKEAQAARGLMSAKQQIVPMLERLKVLRAKTSFAERAADNKGLYESKDTAEIKSLQAQVALGLRELSASSPGAMDKGMQDLAGQIQGNWMATQGHPEAAADAFIGSINRQADSYQRGQGGQAEQQALEQKPDGSIVTKSIGGATFASPKGELPKSFKPAGTK